MCYQCTTDLLNVYSKTQNDVHVYMGIVRRDYEPFERGDIFIGIQNDPDLVICCDLFTRHDWDVSFDIEENRRTACQNAAANLYDVEDLDENFFWNEHLTSHNPCYLASKAAVFQKHFDFSTDRARRFTAALISEAAQHFISMGIPLTKQKRLEWADQFSETVDYVESQHDGSYLLTRLGENGTEEFIWTSTNRIPDEFREYNNRWE